MHVLTAHRCILIVTMCPLSYLTLNISYEGRRGDQNAANENLPCLPEVKCRRNYSAPIVNVLLGCMQAQFVAYRVRFIRGLLIGVLARILYFRWWQAECNIAHIRVLVPGLLLLK